jgi:hypothetical protein
LKAEEVSSRSSSCLIDTEGAKPEGSDKSEGSLQKSPSGPVAEAPKAAAPAPAAALRLQHMLQDTISSCKKILDEKKYSIYCS